MLPVSLPTVLPTEPSRLRFSAACGSTEAAEGCLSTETPVRVEKRLVAVARRPKPPELAVPEGIRPELLSGKRFCRLSSRS
jgi:hypothetical protein